MAVDKSAALPSLQLRVRVPDRVLMRQVGEEMVMLDMEGENYYGLNPVGTRLMQIAESGATLGQISDQLVAEFDVAHGQVQADVQCVAADLIAAGLLEQDASR